MKKTFCEALEYAIPSLFGVEILYEAKKLAAEIMEKVKLVVVAVGRELSFKTLVAQAAFSANPINEVNRITFMPIVSLRTPEK